jgi:RNA polymerase sigma factor (sigma-70 family)
MVGRFARPRPHAEALREVYRDNVEAVYAFFSYSVGRDTAEDLTAAAFERVVRSWPRFDPERAPARTWILAIARNVLTDHFRRQSHRNAVSLDANPALAASLVSSDDPAARYLSTDTVREWLRGLEPRERELLALRFAADLPASEIARILDLTEANVHQIASRALRRLHAQLSRSELTGSA